MSRPAPPALTVRYEGSPRTFAAGSDVVIGRDLRADVRIAHPLISRAHLVLRFDQGRWIAIDNGSLNGMFVNGRRVPAVDITDGQQIHVGNPDGPPLTFEVGRHQGSAGCAADHVGPGRLPAQPSWPTAPPPSRDRRRPPAGYTSAPPATARISDRPRRYPSGPQSTRAPSRRAQRSRCVRAISAPAMESATVMGPAAAPRSERREPRDEHAQDPAAGPARGRATRFDKIGRATDNDIVIPDVLASRHHATLVPGPGAREIRDNRSINGTFVNGTRVDSEMLTDGDTVTIGNVDLVFRDGTLVRRTETAAAPAPAASRSTASPGPSRATRRCWTTSRCRRGRER